MSWFDELSFNDISSSVKSVAGSAVDLWKDYNAANLDLYKFNATNAVQMAQINAAATNAQTQAQLQAMQSNYQLKLAQGQLNNASLYANNGLDMQLGNMNTILGRSAGTSSLMTWLAVAGVVLAVMQYVKK